MLKVTNLKEQKKSGNTTLNMLIYGDSGVGKTTLAATSAELGRVLYIDAESGAKFINNKYADDIDILVLNDVNVLDEVLKTENITEYSTIVLDSITEIMKKMVDKYKGNKEKPTLSDWGSVISNMETYFRRFRDLNKHIILVALSQEKGDDESVLKRPALSGKSLPGDIVGIVDICLYMENSAQGRIAYSQPSIKFYAKDRTWSLPDKIVGDNLNIKWIAEKATTLASLITDEQKEVIMSGIISLGMNDEGVGKMLAYCKADKIENLTEKAANVLIEAINLKLSQKPKEQLVVETPPVSLTMPIEETKTEEAPKPSPTNKYVPRVFTSVQKPDGTEQVVVNKELPL